MISVERPDIPSSLQENQLDWTIKLHKIVKEYAGYENIPETIKSTIVNNYRQDDVKQALSDMTNGKCIYCEAYIEHIDYPHIEHFYPKSIYYLLTFKWSNLFLSCTKCNIHKGDTDTKAHPLVNPERENPEEFFIFKDLRIEVSPTSPDSTKSKNTITYCDLKRVTLSREHSEITLSFQTVEDLLEKAIASYVKLMQAAAKLRKANEILESLDNLKQQSSHTSSYAGYLRYLLRNSSIISKSIDIVNNHIPELGLGGNYNLV